MNSTEQAVQAYQLRIWIREISPQIWRRLLVRSDSTIAQRVKLDPTQPRGMERDQIEHILAAIPTGCQRDRLFFRLLLETGLQVSKGLSLYVESH